MDLVVGLVQLLLAFVFMSAGGLLYGLEPAAVSARLRAWTPDLPPLPLKLAGVVEFGAGVAVLLPLAYEVPAGLPAVGAGVMVLAALTALVIQIRRGSRLRLLLSLLLAVMAVLVLDHHLS